MKYWAGWYDDPNPFRVATVAFSKLWPALVIAGGICILGYLVAEFLTDDQYFFLGDQNIRSVFRIALVALVGGISTAIFGFLAGLVLALFDFSIGKVLSPVVFSTAMTGAAVVPISLVGNFEILITPTISFIAYRYIPTIIVGTVCGIIFAKLTAIAPHWRNKKWELNIRHLLALTFWIALIFGLGLGGAFFAAAIVYIGTVGLVVVLHSLWEQLLVRRRMRG